MKQTSFILPQRFYQMFIGLTFLSLLLFIWNLWGIGSDQEQGEVFRILFLHVPSAWNAFFWFFFGAIFAILSLFQFQKKNQKDWRHWIWAANLVGTLFAAWTLITGSVWGKKTWGVAWYWDPRLTTTLILFLLGCIYHLLDQILTSPLAKQIVPSFVLLLNTLNVPLVYLSVYFWRSIHQPPTFLRKNQSQLVSQDIWFTLCGNLVLFFAWSWFLFFLIKSWKDLQKKLEQMKVESDSFSEIVTLRKVEQAFSNWDQEGI